MIDLKSRHMLFTVGFCLQMGEDLYGELKSSSSVFSAAGNAFFSRFFDQCPKRKIYCLVTLQHKQQCYLKDLTEN